MLNETKEEVVEKSDEWNFRLAVRSVTKFASKPCVGYLLIIVQRTIEAHKLMVMSRKIDL